LYQGSLEWYHLPTKFYEKLPFGLGDTDTQTDDLKMCLNYTILDSPVIIHGRVSSSLRKTTREKQSLKFVRFQVPTAASIKFRIFWNVAPCSHVEVDRRFRDVYYLHHQGLSA
jgi:hypothetical protein